MKNFQWLLLCVFIFSGSVVLQAGEITLDPYLNYTKVISQKNGSTYVSGVYGERGIGKQVVVVSSNTYIDRTFFTFDLSQIPDNAEITQVQVEYIVTGSSSFKFKLTNPNSMDGNKEEIWSRIGACCDLQSNGSP